MNKFLASVLVLLCCAGDAIAAETGRSAVIRLQNDAELRCIILGYADGKFRIQVNGEERTLDMAEVQEITFGTPEGGDMVRRLLAPLQPEERTTEPARLGPKNGSRQPREGPNDPPASPHVLVGRIWRITDRFENLAPLAKLDADIEARLKDHADKGPVNKHLRLLLIVSKMAQGELIPAGNMLDDLKRDYPDDQVLQRTTRMSLLASLGVWKRWRPRPGTRHGPPAPDRPARDRPDGPGKDWPFTKDRRPEGPEKDRPDFEKDHPPKDRSPESPAQNPFQ